MFAPFGPRLLRAAVFTAVCLVLSALGHVLAACAAVPWWTLAIGFLGVFALALPFTGRDRSLPSIASALAGGQLALHALFGLGQQHTAAQASAAAADDALIRAAARLLCGAGASAISPGEAHRIVTTAGLDPAAAAAAAMPAGTGVAVDPQVLPSLSMVLGHLLAALVTGWLLRRGDLAILQLARLAQVSARGVAGVAEQALVRALRGALVLVRALAAGLPAPTWAGPRSRRGDDDIPPPASAEALQHTVIRRGPPAVFTLAA
ncbi:hypothetical protein ACFPM3_11185 [Streptomyces coeruleoprunus]|uniref:Integral membrane protein n=1 Tax=Streptomyces coeruleoprunus TaxID=285563 RepID=A0ABV9XB71_9ACTN